MRRDAGRRAPAENGPDAMRMPGRRILVVGTSGSGKTTTARRLARALGYVHVELDALHWGPDWTPAPDAVFRHRVHEATSGRCWVVDGNFTRVRDIVWPVADTVVWLDYPLPVILGRLLRRTARRVFLRERLWSGNRESLWRLFTADSIILWALKTYRRRRREYAELLARPEYQHLRAIRLRSPTQAEAWLQAVAAVASDTRARDSPVTLEAP
ncbi:AAA family ATPase [Geochorda subterranea]|uniref:AAA family ATPase n=1 Tax=Geochorda subterranea TaxID=3109564 RepID=A0ABZ1BNZ8_9FIRM|nr:AAA family ATPase [Limnochorda sp. LNt]WRP14559.1 AAA family ATPase [Limnochorda sp. LNt]